MLTLEDDTYLSEIDGVYESPNLKLKSVVVNSNDFRKHSATIPRKITKHRRDHVYNNKRNGESNSHRPRAAQAQGNSVHLKRTPIESENRMVQTKSIGTQTERSGPCKCA